MSQSQLDPPRPAQLEAGTAYPIKELISYSPGSVVSRTIKKNDKGTLTVFAFDQGEGLSEHSAPFDAFVQGLDGELELTIGGEPVTLTEGQMVLMPANIPHALKALTPSKMMLVMIRG